MIWKFFAVVGVICSIFMGLAAFGALVSYRRDKKRRKRMKYYVTFGQRYRREPHPILGDFPQLPDGYLLIEADTEEQARSMVAFTFEDHWASIYPYRENDSMRDKLYPLGVLGEISVEGVRVVK